MKKELKINSTKFALAAGIITAIIIFFMTILAIFTTFSPIVIIFALYGTMGYTISVTGAFIGAIYSFIDTFIFAWLFAWLYNKLL